MTWEPLPNRRPSETLAIEHANAEGIRTSYEISVDRYLDNRIGEVAITSPAPDSTLGVLFHDAASLISLALQHGLSPNELKDGMARYDATSVQRAKPKSGIGAILDTLAEMQADYPLAVGSHTAMGQTYENLPANEAWRYVLSAP